MTVQLETLDPELAQQAARWLMAAAGPDTLSLADAMEVVAYMHLHWVAAGEHIVREGQTDGLDQLWLVLDGELSVENNALQEGESEMVVRVMGAGSLIGELSLLDGGPRSANCVATTDILAATLSRADFHRLLAEQPHVGVSLLLAISRRMANHVRDLTRKLQLFAQMNRTLGQELESAPVTQDVDWPAIEEQD